MKTLQVTRVNKETGDKRTMKDELKVISNTLQSMNETIVKNTKDIYDIKNNHLAHIEPSLNRLDIALNGTPECPDKGIVYQVKTVSNEIKWLKWAIVYGFSVIAIAVSLWLNF